MSFLSNASRQVVDVRSFLRDSAGGNSIKYTAESGAKHQIYVPYTTVEVPDENGNMVPMKQLIAISGSVHEWRNPDGKYKASICLKDVIRKSDDGATMLNDGTCPLCDRVSAAWDIYRYRMEMEEANCKLTGEQRKSHLENVKASFADERKMKDAKPYMYILIVKFRTDANGHETLGDDGLPEYDLKVMKLSASRVEKISQQLENAGTQLIDSEIIFGYPKNDDRRLVVSQSTTSPVFPQSRFTVKYPNLLNKINKDVAKFEWDGIEKSFPEWSGMTTFEAKNVTNALFEKWDEYQKEIQVNPGAKYLEYVTSTPMSTPDINGVAPTGMPVVPQIPVVPGAEAPQMPQMPQMPNIPETPAVDPNAAFAGTTPIVPSI